jgi:hypothetical protein
MFKLKELPKALKVYKNLNISEKIILMRKR